MVENTLFTPDSSSCFLSYLGLKSPYTPNRIKHRSLIVFLHSKTIGISIPAVCILVATIAYVSLTMLDEATKEIHDLSERLGTPPTSQTQQENRTYEQAFNQGFDAFMRQYGIPQKTWKYTNQEMHTTENFDLDAEKIFMGYADGYHAAAKQVFGTGNCTR